MKYAINATKTGVPLLFAILTIAILARYNASGVLNTDFYTHLMHGEWIVTHLALPPGDFYSWTKDSQAYPMTQWLSELILASAWMIGGGWATKLLAASVALATVIMVYRAARVGIEDGSAAAFTTLILTGWVVLSITAGPKMFSIVLFAAVVFLAARWKEKRIPAYLIAIPMVIGLWANMDVDFPIGIIYLVLVALGLTAEQYVIKHEGWASRIALPIASAVGLAAVASLLNPYGITVWSYDPSNPAWSAMLPEMARPTLLDIEGTSILVGVSITIAAAGFSRRRMRLEEMIIFVIFLMVSSWSRHNAAYFMITITPIVARHGAETPFADVMLPAFRKEMSFTSQIISIIVAIPLAMTASYILKVKGEKFFRQEFSVDAMKFIVANGLTDRLMHDYRVGGYYAYAGGIKTFTDARPTLYDRKFITGMQSAFEARPGYKAFIETWKPSAVLVPDSAPLREALLLAGNYALVYDNKQDSVLVRRNAGHDDLIAADENHSTQHLSVASDPVNILADNASGLAKPSGAK